MCTVGRSGRLSWIEGLRRHGRCRPEVSNPRLGGGGGSDPWPPRALLSSRLLKSAPVPGMSRGDTGPNLREQTAALAGRLPSAVGASVSAFPPGSRIRGWWLQTPRGHGMHPRFPVGGSPLAGGKARRPQVWPVDCRPRRPTIACRPSSGGDGRLWWRQGPGCTSAIQHA